MSTHTSGCLPRLLIVVLSCLIARCLMAALFHSTARLQLMFYTQHHRAKKKTKVNVVQYKLGRHVSFLLNSLHVARKGTSIKLNPQPRVLNQRVARPTPCTQDPCRNPRGSGGYSDQNSSTGMYAVCFHGALNGLSPFALVLHTHHSMFALNQA